MIDWMFEVLNIYNMKEQTFFLSVQIMDRYFALVSHSLELHELHIIGITSMFIASKYEEIDPFYMRTIVARIGKYRFT